MKKFLTNIIIVTFTANIFVGVLFAPVVNAADGRYFQPGTIVSDSIFFNSSAMNSAQIQAFLNAKVPSCRAGYTCLKDYSMATPDKSSEASLCNTYRGGTKTAAQIIYDVGSACGVNPQTILVLLQKEQSLVTDTWPEDIQYRSATGYGCPDTAACDSTYYGFFNQVYMAARQYRVYAKNSSSYNYRTGRNNTILWHPNAACGTSQVYIYSQATAGLYNYTPYRPNQAALDNLYGTGDGCSSYGNRNFWRLFTDWFGSTSGGVGLVKSTDSGAVFAWYGGKKQGIPSLDVLDAWGFDKLPVTEMTPETFNLIPSLPNLSRLVKNPYNSNLYLLADNAGTYDTLANGALNWGFNPATAPDIGEELITATSRLGVLSPFFTYSGASAIYAADAGTYRSFSDPTTYTAWSLKTRTITVSPELFADLTAGQALSSTRVSAASSKYFIKDGSSLAVPTTLTASFPASVQTVSTTLMNEIPVAGSVSKFVQSPAGTIYLVDGGKKFGIGSLAILFSIARTNQPAVTALSTADIQAIPDGKAITNRFVYSATDNSKQYYVDASGLKSLPAAIFNASSYGTPISDTGLSLIDQNPGTIGCGTGLMKSSSSAAIFILDAGVKRGIPSLDTLALVGGDNSVCVFPDEDAGAITEGPIVSPFVSYSGTNYVLEGAKRYTVASDAAANLGIASFSPVGQVLLNNYSANGALGNTFTTSSSRYVFAESGRYYSTTNSAVASLWGVNTTGAHSDRLLDFMQNGGELTQFASSTSAANGTIYLVDGQKLLPMTSLNYLFNAGFNWRNIVRVSESYINANKGSLWQGYLAYDASSSTYYVLEGGKKHPIPAAMLPNWLGTTNPITPTQLSSTFLNMLPTGTSATKSIATNAPGIFGLNDGKKAGIPNLKTYTTLYAPSMSVSQNLIDSIPNGSPITPL